MRGNNHTDVSYTVYRRAFLPCISLWWWRARGHSLHAIILPLHDLEKIDAARQLRSGLCLWTVMDLAAEIEDSGHIALVNDWWHLQDLWSLKVVPLLKSHKEGNKSWADPCRKLQEWTSSWFISVSSLLLLGASMDGRSLWHFLHWPALSQWQQPCAKAQASVVEMEALCLPLHRPDKCFLVKGRIKVEKDHHPCLLRLEAQFCSFDRQSHW